MRTPGFGERRGSSTSGVLPIDSRTFGEAPPAGPVEECSSSIASNTYFRKCSIGDGNAQPSRLARVCSAWLSCQTFNERNQADEITTCLHCWPPWSLVLTAGFAVGCGDDDDDGGDTRRRRSRPRPDHRTGSCWSAPTLPIPPFEIGQPPDITGYDIEVDQRDRREARPRGDLPGHLVRHDLPRHAPRASSTSAVAASTITPEREQTVDFSDPYYQADAVAAGRGGTPTSRPSTTSAATIVGAQDGTTGEALRQRRDRRLGGPRLPRGPRRDQRAAQRPGRRGDHRPAGRGRTRSRSRAASRSPRRSSPTSSTASRSPRTTTRCVEPVNEALAEIKEDGTLDGLYEQYFQDGAARVGARGHDEPRTG